MQLYPGNLARNVKNAIARKSAEMSRSVGARTRLSEIVAEPAEPATPPTTMTTYKFELDLS